MGYSAYVGWSIKYASVREIVILIVLWSLHCV
jgi:hypothetical protein